MRWPPPTITLFPYTTLFRSQERRPAEARRPRERRRDGREAGNELREHQRQPPPALEAELRLAHTGIGRKGHAAQELHHAAAVAPARAIPGRAKIGRAHARTPVTSRRRMPSSA